MTGVAAAAVEARPALPSDWPALHRAACVPYRAAGRFAWHFARGKLGRDPVFRHLAMHGLLEPRGHSGGGEAPPVRLLDIGCGQGLLASLLAALDAGFGVAAPAPAALPAVPRGRWRYSGIDLAPRDIERAQAALAGLDPPPRFACADMRDAAFAPCDVVVALDVLQHVDLAAQRGVLERLREALSPGGRLLLRVGDMIGTGDGVSPADGAPARTRAQRAPPVFGRPLADWIALLDELGFVSVETVPMSHGTPFENVLLVADTPAALPAADSPAS